jgi:hypothetical protein
VIAAVPFIWDGTTYAAGDTIPAMSVTQSRHAQRRGYIKSGATLLVGKPFSSGGSAYASGAALPAGLTDIQTRRLVAGRFLI